MDEDEFTGVTEEQLSTLIDPDFIVSQGVGLEATLSSEDLEGEE